jgi:hypothetical protein
MAGRALATFPIIAAYRAISLIGNGRSPHYKLPPRLGQLVKTFMERALTEEYDTVVGKFLCEARQSPAVIRNQMTNREIEPARQQG